MMRSKGKARGLAAFGDVFLALGLGNLVTGRFPIDLFITLYGVNRAE
jgi:hypothetical protein